MAFRLRRTESVEDGLKRLARKALRSARIRLRRARPPSVEAVHEARKSIKKVRAIGYAIDADAGRGLDDSEKRLRRVNRKLSKLRDADVIVESLTTLRHKYPRVLSEHTFGRVRRRLLRRARQVADTTEHDRTWKKADRTLRAVRRRAKRWRPSHGGFTALAAGIRSAHQRGRKALARAQQSRRAAHFHEWRQEMKTLWYQLRLVEGSGVAVRRDVQALRRAETWLGDDHNMAVLCAELLDDVSTTDGALDVTRLRCAVDAYQRQLRDMAISQVRAIYGLTSGAYVRRVSRAWKAWHRPGRTRRAARSKRAAA
jgi:CHAD domain-containing protein